MATINVPASLLSPALSELSARCVGACTGAVSALDSAVQDQLSRQDEIAALVDAARLDVQYTTDVAFAKVHRQSKVRRDEMKRQSRKRKSNHAVRRYGVSTAQRRAREYRAIATHHAEREASRFALRLAWRSSLPPTPLQELEALFAVIDAAAASADAAYLSVTAAAERLDVLTAAVAEGAAPAGLAKVANFFKRSSSSGSAVPARTADAPTRLPPYTPARIDVASHMAALRVAVGGDEALAAARAGAATAAAAASQQDTNGGAAPLPNFDDEEEREEGGAVCSMWAM